MHRPHDGSRCLGVAEFRVPVSWSLASDDTLLLASDDTLLLASDDTDDEPASDDTLLGTSMASEDTLMLGTHIDPDSSPHPDAADDVVMTMSVPDFDAADFDGTQIACDPDGEPLITQFPDDPAGYVTDHGYVADSVVEPKDNGKAVLVIESRMLPLNSLDVGKHCAGVRKCRIREKSKPRDDANVEKPSDHAHDKKKKKPSEKENINMSRIQAPGVPESVWDTSEETVQKILGLMLQVSNVPVPPATTPEVKIFRCPKEGKLRFFQFWSQGEIVGQATEDQFGKKVNAAALAMAELYKMGVPCKDFHKIKEKVIPLLLE